MKIIRPGQIPEKRIFQHTCDRCGTIFEFAKREATRNYDQREYEEWWTIQCPLIGCDNDCNVTKELK